MKNHLKISIVVLVINSFLFSCTPDNLVEEGTAKEQFQEHAIGDKGEVTNKPTSDEDN